MLELLRVETFAPHVGSSFRIVPDEGGALEVELVEAADFGTPVPAGGRVPFRLLFHGPRGPVLPQRIYRFEHPVLEPCDLFIVPIGPAGDRMRYEAIFT